MEIASRAEVQGLRHWPEAFANLRKDHRYYELVEDTIKQGFEYGYFVIRDDGGEACAIQPYFINDQDLLGGTEATIKNWAGLIRRVWPGFLRMRTLMIGCAAGEGRLDANDDASRFRVAQSLAEALGQRSRELKAGLVVFKEFTTADRPALACLKKCGFARVPSLPMTRLRLEYASFDDYLRKALSRNMRSKLRRKYKASAQRAALEMSIVSDATPYIAEIYPLYLAVYERSKLKFEKLTPEYFCEIGRRLPEKALFFLWKKEGKIVAFNLCMTNGDTICSEYVGFDYSLAFELHLYYIVVRDITAWAIAKNYKWYCSTSLNYEPKYHLRHELKPLHLYVKHTSGVLNFILKRTLRFLDPVRYDKQLRRFPNYEDLYP